MSSCAQSQQIRQVCFQDSCFSVEIADDPEEQAMGLMFRETLAEDAGMLFVFDRDDRYFFWMKNTFIPLDLMWLDKDMKVAYIEENVPPCQNDPCPSYGPSIPARYVLELNAGTVQRLGLKTGNQARNFAPLDNAGH
ncbi:MAG: DUF192 domain-containing protein [Candidatus Omnitrophota bacterium]